MDKGKASSHAPLPHLVLAAALGVVELAPELQVAAVHEAQLVLQQAGRLLQVGDERLAVLHLLRQLTASLPDGNHAGRHIFSQRPTEQVRALNGCSNLEAGCRSLWTHLSRLSSRSAFLL